MASKSFPALESANASPRIHGRSNIPLGGDRPRRSGPTPRETAAPEHAEGSSLTWEAPHSPWSVRGRLRSPLDKGDESKGFTGRTTGLSECRVQSLGVTRSGPPNATLMHRHDAP